MFDELVGIKITLLTLLYFTYFTPGGCVQITALQGKERYGAHLTLSEKESKFPRYNMKCKGKHDIIITVHEIFLVVSCFPRFISCYIAENQLPLGQCIADYNSMSWLIIFVLHIFWHEFSG